MKNLFKNRPELNWTILIIVFAIMVIATPCFASFESSLIGLKTKLTTVVLPLLSVIGLVCAAISLYTGNPNAKQHIMYAVFGCIIGFGAQSIVDLISQTVH